MSRPQPAVTVVVVTYNSAAVLPGFLASLDAGAAGVDWSLVVVDNDSADASLEVVGRERPESTRVQTGRNAGYAAGVNAGIAAAAADASHYLVLNPDVRLAEGALARLVDAMARSAAGIAVPRLQSEDGTPLFSLRRDPSVLRTLGEAVLGGGRAGRHARLGEVVTDPQAYGRPGWVDWATGAAMLVSRECADAVGPWDERFFLYSEETDFCRRARAAGYGVRYVPDAVAVHLEGDLERSPALRTHLVRNKLRHYRSTHGAASSLAFRAALTANEASRAATGSERHRAGLAELMRPERAAARGPAAPEHPSQLTPFVFFSAQDYWYHNRAHSDIQLARNLARTRTTVFVNSIGMRMPTPGRSTQFTRRVLRKLGSMARTVRRPDPALPSLYVMSPVILPFYGSPLMRRVNAAVVRAQVRAVLRAVSGPQEPHVVATIPTSWDVVRGLPRTSLLVNRSDKYSAYGETDQDLMRRLEESLLAAGDAALYVNHRLMDEERDLVGGEAVFLGHGVDFDHFAGPGPADVPPDLAAVPGPRVGFFGGIDDYVVDLDLVARLADELPDASIVLVGDATCPMDELTRRPNVHWLGARPYEEIPSYGAGFDVAIMPWLQNEWIEHCNPIKTKEYLALGKPVVTTRYPEAEWMADVIDIADSAEEFVALVSAALAGKDVSTADDRRARVATDSWASRAEVIVGLAERSGA